MSAASQILLVLGSVILVQGQSIQHVSQEASPQISVPSAPLRDTTHWMTNLCASSSKEFPTEQFANAANRWMRVPIDTGKQQDSATPSDRQARDQHWDKYYGATLPLSNPCSRPKPIPMADFFPEELTQEELQEGAWVVGRFEDYSTRLSAAELSIYTEIRFRVSRVLGTPTIPGLRNGSVIFIGCAGGTIAAPWGKEISFRVYPKTYFFLPSHTYLLHLSYLEDGSFFIFTEGSGRRWDVVDGIAKPDSGMEVSKSQHGKPSISGLPLEKAVEILESRIEQSERKERQ